MAFPSIRSQTSSAEPATVTAHTINYPATISAGDGLLCLVASDGNNTFDWAAAESSRGWVKLYEVSSSDSQTCLSVGYIEASGSESGSFELSSSENEQSSARMFAIQDTTPSIPPVVSASNQSAGSATVTFLNCNPGTAYDFMWFIGAAYDDDDGGMGSNFPTNYQTNSQYDISNTGNGTCGLDTSYRTNNASSEDPGDGTAATAEEWVSVVIAVYPAGVGVTHSGVGTASLALTTNTPTGLCIDARTASESLAVTVAATAIVLPVVLDAEDGTTDAFTSVDTTGGNTFTATTASKLNGTYGFEAAFDGSNYHAQGLYTLDTLHDDLHFGIRFKLKTGWDHPDGTLLTIMDIMDGPSTGNVRAAFRIYNNSGSYYLRMERLNPTASGGSDVAIDVGTEYWIEIRHKKGSGDGAIEWWVGDTKEGELTGLTTGGIDRVEVGSTGYPTQPNPGSGDSIYLDDLMLNAVRSGAQPVIHSAAAAVDLALTTSTPQAAVTREATASVTGTITLGTTDPYLEIARTAAVDLVINPITATAETTYPWVRVTWAEFYTPAAAGQVHSAAAAVTLAITVAAATTVEYLGAAAVTLVVTKAGVAAVEHVAAGSATGAITTAAIAEAEHSAAASVDLVATTAGTSRMTFGGSASVTLSMTTFAVASPAVDANASVTLVLTHVAFAAVEHPGIANIIGTASSGGIALVDHAAFAAAALSASISAVAATEHVASASENLAITVNAVASVEHQAAVSESLAITVVATPSVVYGGVASETLVITTEAIGAFEGVFGVASETLAISVLAAATMDYSAVASETLQASVSAVPSLGVSRTASETLTASTAAQGSLVVARSASVTLVLTTTAVASPSVDAVASETLTLSVNAVPSVDRGAVASETLIITTTAVATPSVDAIAAVDLALTVAASASVEHVASASESLVITTSATGTTGQDELASASETLVITATAIPSVERAVAASESLVITTAAIGTKVLGSPTVSETLTISVVAVAEVEHSASASTTITISTVADASAEVPAVAAVTLTITTSAIATPDVSAIGTAALALTTVAAAVVEHSASASETLSITVVGVTEGDVPAIGAATLTLSTAATAGVDRNVSATVDLALTVAAIYEKVITVSASETLTITTAALSSPILNAVADVLLELVAAGALTPHIAGFIAMHVNVADMTFQLEDSGVIILQTWDRVV